MATLSLGIAVLAGFVALLTAPADSDFIPLGAGILPAVVTLFLYSAIGPRRKKKEAQTSEIFEPEKEEEDEEKKNDRGIISSAQKRIISMIQKESQRASMEHNPQPVFSIDPDRKILQMNAAAESLMSEQVGDHCVIFTPEEIRLVVQYESMVIEKVIKYQKVIFHIEFDKQLNTLFVYGDKRAAIVDVKGTHKPAHAESSP